MVYFSLFFLLIVPIGFGLFLHPCSKYRMIEEPSMCHDVKGFGACAVSPWLSWFLCTTECGWCQTNIKNINNKKEGEADGASSSKKGSNQWQPIDRIHVTDLTYDYFVEHYKRKNIPLVIEGWLDPKVTKNANKMMSWNLTKLSAQCGRAPVSCTQRRAHAIKMLMDMVKKQSPLPNSIKYLDQYLNFRFGTTFGDELIKAQRKMNLADFISLVQEVKVSEKKVDFRSLLDYMASALTVNDFSVAEVCVCDR
jgi:hypothetical protein